MAEEIDLTIKINNDAFHYLKHQKGRIETLARNRHTWYLAYINGIISSYRQMKPWLPKIDRAECMLDIGSGLGGIDIFINRHYNGEMTPILMDGMDDPPVMELHRKTFSNFKVAQQFHADNGVRPILPVNANDKVLLNLSEPVPLVISLGAWCFHLPPEQYFEYVVNNAKPRATVIVDVRKHKEWLKRLGKIWNLRAIIHTTDKLDRCVFELPG